MATPTERRLHALCQSSFLKLWAHASVYRNQGRNGATSHGKEICDEIVLFDDHIILFSDKECDFGTTGDLGLRWKRWRRRAIEKSIDQLFGAERWLKRYPDRIFIDAACTRPLPVSRTPGKSQTFHRVAVASGAKHACQEHHRGGTGSLVLVPSLGSGSGSDIEKAYADQPFSVGGNDPRGFVHVLDDASLDVVLAVLNTASDFIEYLEWKERLVTHPQFQFCAGEEELVAMFLGIRLGDADPIAMIPPDRRIAIPEGWWDGLLRDPRYHAYLEATSDSYLWDQMVDDFAAETLSGNMANYLIPGGEGDPAVPAGVHERRLRALARPSRMVRAALSSALIGFIREARLRRGEVYTRTARPNGLPDTGYVFLSYPFDATRWPSYREYRTDRQSAIAAYCAVFKLVHPELRDVVGIASEYDDDVSFDIQHIGADEWDETSAAAARHFQAEFGILVDLRDREIEASSLVDGPATRPPTGRKRPGPRHRSRK